MTATVKTENFTMDYCCFGNGKKAFVIIPGLSTGKLSPLETALKAEYSNFTDDFTVYLFDRRNEIPVFYDTADMAEDTAKAMAELGLENVCLYGTSQGGMIVQLIAENHPELVDRLIIASSSSRPGKVCSDTIGRWLDIAKAGDGKALNRDMIDKCYSAAYINRYRELMDSCIVDMSREVLDKFIMLAAPIITFDHFEDLKKIQCKTLVIGCEGDLVFSPEPAKDMAKALDCRLVMYGKKFGHCVYDENPDCISELLSFATEE